MLDRSGGLFLILGFSGWRDVVEFQNLSKGDFDLVNKFYSYGGRNLI